MYLWKKDVVIKLLAIFMKNTIHILIILMFFSCQEQNKDIKTKKEQNLSSIDSQISNEVKVLFSAYTTAENGLNFHKEPNINSEILGKFTYGTKVDIVDSRNRSLFWVDAPKRASLYGKWVGIIKDSSIVYAFNAHLFKSSSDIDNHIKIINGKLEVVYNEVRMIDSNNKLIIEMHIQTSNHLADYLLVKLQTNNQIVYIHKIEHLFKESYELKRTEDLNPTFEYFTLFDECPSRNYKQTFSISGNKIIIINDDYYEAEEKE